MESCLYARSTNNYNYVYKENRSKKTHDKVWGNVRK